MISFKVNEPVSAKVFQSLLKRCSLGERRPVDDEECLKGMVENSNLMVSAWFENKLIGIARSMTDFHYACYLSDIAVDDEFQNKGVGRQLIEITRGRLGSQCKLILISAPAASDYYPKLGFAHNNRCWVLPG